MEVRTVGIAVATWLSLCFVAGAIAGGKGRSAAGFFFLSLLLSPLVGILAALIADPDTARVEAERVQGGTQKRCPFCAELIRTEAIVCRFCGRDMPNAADPPQSESCAAASPQENDSVVTWIIWIVLLLMAAGLYLAVTIGTRWE